MAVVKKLSREEQKEIRREEIIYAANELFITKGLLETRMSDVANKVGMNVRTVYRYFATKETLAFEIEIDLMKKLMKRLGEQEIKGETGLEKLKKALSEPNLGMEENQIRFFAEFDYYFQDAYPDISVSYEFVSLLQNSNSSLIDYVNEGVKDGSIREDMDPMLALATIVNSLLALHKRVVLRGEHLDIEQGISSKNMPKCLFDLIFDGLASR
jgi:AcrR family transcriptional regulator